MTDTLKSVGDSDEDSEPHENGEGGRESEEEVGGGFSGIRMESVKDIIAKARFAESYLRGGSGVELGENLEELAQIVEEEEPKAEEGVTDMVDHEEIPAGKEDLLDDLNETELDEVKSVQQILYLITSKFMSFRISTLFPLFFSFL